MSEFEQGEQKPVWSKWQHKGIVTVGREGTDSISKYTEKNENQVLNCKRREVQ